MLFCGSRGYGPARRVLLGGVSARLVRRRAARSSWCRGDSPTGDTRRARRAGAASQPFRPLVRRSIWVEASCLALRSARFSLIDLPVFLLSAPVSHHYLLLEPWLRNRFDLPRRVM